MTTGTRLTEQERASYVEALKVRHGTDWRMLDEIYGDQRLHCSCPDFGNSPRPLLRLPLCWLSMRPHVTREDDQGIWGECTICKNRVGHLSRETLRNYIDRAPGA